MSDAVTAAADLLRAVPVRVRQGLYGLFALVILIDGWWDILPDDIAGRVAATFAGLTMILALVNTGDRDVVPPH